MRGRLTIARNARGRPRKRGSKQGEVVEVVNGFELKPSSYQPSKAELEADISLPASFDEVVDALFTSDAELAKDDSDSASIDNA